MATAAVPPGESIIVPPDQRFKEVKCHACGVTAKTETRFKGIYTCTTCQWKGLAPPKQEESVVNAVVTEEKEGKKKRSGGLRESQAAVEEEPAPPEPFEFDEVTADRAPKDEDMRG